MYWFLPGIFFVVNVVAFMVSIISEMGWEAVRLMMSEPDWGMDGGLERLVIGSSVRLA